MKPDGTLEAVTAPNARESAAEAMILYAPRKVTLPPNQPQSIRINARAPQGLADGEYRVHLLFRAIPEARPATAPAPTQGVSFRLTPVYGVTIPVIVRLGNLDGDRGIANVAKAVDRGKPVIALDLSRARRSLDLWRSARDEGRHRRADRGRRRNRALHRNRQAPGHHPDRRALRGAGDGPGDGRIYRKDPDRHGHARLDQRHPALDGRGGSGTAMRGGRTLIGMAALLALACAGAAASSAESPTPFAVDPEAQYLLDVNIRQLRLGEGVRGYPTPEGSCLLLGDMVNVLDVPLKVDLAAKKASGWAFREDNRLDHRRRRAHRPLRRPGRKRSPRPRSAKPPEGWCVDSAALARWLGIGIKVSPYSSLVTLDQRGQAAGRTGARTRYCAPSTSRSPPLSRSKACRQVKLAYRMWRAPRSTSSSAPG